MESRLDPGRKPGFFLDAARLELAKFANLIGTAIAKKHIVLIHALRRSHYTPYASPELYLGSAGGNVGSDQAGMPG